MKTFTVDVTQRVEVTLDETKFDEAFMAEFCATMFSCDTVEEHAAHLAQLHATGRINDFGDPFIEGYGWASSRGIKFADVDARHEIVPDGPEYF